MARPSALVTGAVAFLTAPVPAACGNPSPQTQAGAGESFTAARSGSAQDPASVGTRTIGRQTGWVPQAEHGPVYQMLGGSYSIEAAHKRVTGELIDGKVDTGVQLQEHALVAPARQQDPTEADRFVRSVSIL
jgi:hypothetical protein